MVNELVKSKLEYAISSCGGVRIIPLIDSLARIEQLGYLILTNLQILCDSIPQINGRPIRVIARIECSTVRLKLIRELARDQI